MLSRDMEVSCSAVLGIASNYGIIESTLPVIFLSLHLPRMACLVFVAKNHTLFGLEKETGMTDAPPIDQAKLTRRRWTTFTL